MRGWITEVFESIQGEGLYVGERHIFVRFSGCNLRCAFCDTPRSRVRRERCAIGTRARTRSIPNPIEESTVIRAISTLSRDARTRTVSLTGGEPLLQAEFAGSLTRRLKQEEFRTYLETNGTLPEGLTTTLPYLDIVSMDWKLASSSGQSDSSRAHEDFLRLCRGPSLFIKMVITPTTAEKEFRKAVARIAGVNSRLPLILQPVTPRTRAKRPSTDFLLGLQEIALRHLLEVRIIPQNHPLLGIK